MSQIERPTDSDKLLALRRRLTGWRIFAAIALIVAAVSFFGVVKIGQYHVARIEVVGVIFEDHPRHVLLRKLAQDDNVGAVIVHINSPGGTITGSEEIYQDLRAIADEKPVIAVMGGVAASGGYIAALGADHILARQTTITGSIGVIFQWFEFTELAQKIGVKPHVLRSGELKAQPDMFEAPSEKALRVERELIKEGFVWFIDLVAARRALVKANLLKIAGDGRVLSAPQALQYRLIDNFGGIPEARDWLADEHNIAVDLPLIDHVPEYPDEGWFGWILGKTLAKTLKMTGLAVPLGAQESLRQPSGLLTIWRP